MKVIDLLNKIANGEEVPEKIIIDREVYLYDDKTFITNCMYFKEKNEDCWLDYCNIDDEIEIIEEPKKIEKLPYCEENTFKNIKECSYLSVEEKRLLDSNFKTINEKFNEIIDYINKGQE